MVLPVAITNISTHIDELVRLYNRQSKEYRVELVTYERSANLSKNDLVGELELQLMRGEGPDIMELTSMYVDTLADKGAFEDLTTYYQTSDKVKEEDLLGCVRKSGSPRGQNILVIPSFYVNCMISNQEIEPSEWTPWLYLEMASERQITMSQGWYRAFLYCMGIQFGEHFIDYENRESYFDSAEFISLLEQCAQLKTIETSLENGYPPLKEADYMLDTVALRDTDDYLMARYMNGQIYGLGRPGWNGAENEMYPDDVFAMNSASSNKEGAWDFLEFLLSRELQDRIDWGFPARRDSFEDYLHSSYLSEEYRVEEFNLTVRTPYMRELAEEEYAVIRNVVESSVFQSWGGNDNPIQEIVIDEASMYVSGDATMEETIKKIQGRVKLYLHEL